MSSFQEEHSPLLSNQKSPKILSSTISDGSDELVAPLLANSSDEENHHQPSSLHHHHQSSSSAIAAALHAASSSLAMDNTHQGASVDFVEETMTNRILTKLVSIKTLADSLPTILQFVVYNGKMSSLIFIGIYMILLLLWLPFWCLAYLITELGVYIFLLLTVLFVGRVIIRLLAFPGSSSRVPAEIETEFSRYSVRMVQSSACCMVDLCNALLANTTSPSASGNLVGYYDVPGLWARAKSYRDRVLGMYYHVLVYLYQEPSSAGTAAGSNGSDDSTTKYGNNKIVGDIGDLSGLTVSELYTE